MDIKDDAFQKRLESIFPLQPTRETLILRRFVVSLWWALIGVGFGYYWCWRALT